MGKFFDPISIAARDAGTDSLCIFAGKANIIANNVINKFNNKEKENSENDEQMYR